MKKTQLEKDKARLMSLVTRGPRGRIGYPQPTDRLGKPAIDQVKEAEAERQWHDSLTRHRALFTASGIPERPDVVYRDTGWRGWEDWGTFLNRWRCEFILLQGFMSQLMEGEAMTQTKFRSLEVGARIWIETRRKNRVNWFGGRVTSNDPHPQAPETHRQVAIRWDYNHKVVKYPVENSDELRSL